MNVEKLRTYWNLMLKSGKAVIGTDAVLKSKKLFLVAVSTGIADNAVKKLEEYTVRNKVKLVFLDGIVFDEIVKNSKVKVIGFQNKNLGKAFEENLG